MDDPAAKRRGGGGDRRRRGKDGGDGGDEEAWANLGGTFREVQTVLDRNRELIQQVNENHQSRIGANMAKNVPLIQEINQNISKISNLYSDMSSGFVSTYHDRKKDGGNAKA
ncbi:Protein EARLY FLOWERING 4 [Linum grandiflorum]